jgi:tetratricopeptide (TPR) repeat protein
MNYHIARYSAPFRFGSKAAHHSLALLLCLFLLVESMARAFAPSPRLFAQSGAGPNPIVQGEKDTRPLEPGKPVERELAGGQSHDYQITLSAGQFMKVIVEQRGIDVVVGLLGPDAKPIMEFDSEIRSQGQETVWQVAEVAGSYRLNVKAKHKGAPAGGYEIRVAELRAATEKDRVLQEARNLHMESQRLYRAGKYDESRPAAERALELREKALGPESPDVAVSLNNLAIIYRDKGDYAKAEPMFQRALDIREKVFGPNHPEVARALSNLASLYLDKGDYARAEPLLINARDIRMNTLGPEHPDSAAALSSLAILYSYKGDYAEAERLFQRTLDIREKVFGPNHPEVARALTNLASLRIERGNYDKAEPLFLRAQNIWEQTLGSEHPELVTFLNNLAFFYRSKGDYTKAEPLFLRAQAILEKTFKREHPAVADALFNLAVLYEAKGDFAKAEPLYQSALAIREKVFGPNHPEVARVLNSLGDFYGAKGDYTKAEPLLQRARAILEKAHGPEHPEVARALSNLASLYLDKGDHARAEPLLINARDIWMKTLGLEHRNVSLALTNLAIIYHAKGDYAKAEPLYKRALDIREKTLGPEHPKVGVSLNLLARLYEAKGDLALAVTFQSRANEVSERNIALNLVTGSERQKLAYLATLLAQTDQIISLHARSAPDNSTARSLAATTILQRKGRVLDAMSDSIEALRRAASPQDSALFDQLKDIRSQQARLVFGGLQRTTPAEYQSQIRDLAERAEKLEDEISRRSDKFRAEYQPVTLAAVQSAIPAGTTLIEFYSYHPFNAKSARPAEAFGQARYVAYVLRRQGEAQWVDLGEAASIDRAVTALRQALGSPNRADVRQLARALDEKVMRPVRKLVGDIRTLLLSPDGALNLIPFGALVDEQKRYLIENYSFMYLTSGRDLLRLQAHTPSQQGPVVVANPLFDLGNSAIVNNQTADQGTESRRSIDFTMRSFDPLPGAAAEAKALGAILPEAKILTGAQATEAEIKQVRGPLILHVATHGFFLEDRKSATPDRSGPGLEEGAAGLKQTQDALTENPLLRAGLILAGIKQNQSGPGEDGVLTALEAAGLDLWGTKLVMLSACDTGLGEVKNGDGVYGLRRALALGGSESQVMGLWKVADKATRELMVGYYTGLQRGEGRSEALRNVQLQMLRSRERRHPYYWAGFIQSGEWANLEGKR